MGIEDAVMDVSKLQSNTNMKYFTIARNKFSAKHVDEPLIIKKLDKCHTSNPKGHRVRVALSLGVPRSKTGRESCIKIFKNSRH